MDEPRDIKRCRWCRSEIDARAPRCPFCAAAQSSWQWLTYPYAVALAMPLWALIVTAFMTWAFLAMPARLLDTGEPYTEHAGELRVVESRIEHGRGDGGPLVLLVGRLRNEGRQTWAYPRVNVAFLDGEGALVDARTVLPFDRQLRPGQEAAFQAVLAPDLAPQRYASNEAEVVWAADPGH